MSTFDMVLSLVLVAGITGAGGWSLGRLPRKPKKKPEHRALLKDELLPRCLCNHGFTFHHNRGYDCAQCNCTHYMGPDPTITGLWSVPLPPKPASTPVVSGEIMRRG